MQDKAKPDMEDEQLQNQVLRDIMDEEKSGETTPDKLRKPCVICLDMISEHSVTDPCAHAFDFLCIVNWLERTPTCPLCKTQVRTIEYDHGDDRTFKTYHVAAQPARSTTSGATESVSRSRQQEQGSQAEQLQSIRSSETSSSSTRLSAEESLSRRSQVYRRQLYSLHIGSNKTSRFQELSPKRFRRDEELISRARKWIRRELQVFTYLAQPSEVAPPCGSRTWWVGNPEYLLEWIIAILKSVNIKDSSGKAEDMLQEVLGRNNARLFLHELRAWLRSPFQRIQDWDQYVQYNEMI